MVYRLFTGSDEGPSSVGKGEMMVVIICIPVSLASRRLLQDSRGLAGHAEGECCDWPVIRSRPARVLPETSGALRWEVRPWI